MNTTLVLQRVRENWKSGLTVALVSLPLSVSLAIASGAAPQAGIVTAIWAGFIAALFGGSHFNIIGPAGALSGILAMYVAQYGPAALPTLAFASGLIVLVAWVIRAERFLVFVPASTMHGFTLGVGIIIALNQINAAFGLKPAHAHPEFLANILESFRSFGTLSPVTAGVFVASMAFLIVALKLVRKIPGAILLAPIGILLGWLMSLGTIPGGEGVVTVGERFGSLSGALGTIPTLVLTPGLLQAAVAVALVAILETMLTARIADTVTKQKHNARKELFALGLANLGSALAGGMPATGVLVRTSLNAKSGATHKTSGLLNAGFPPAISLVLLPTFQYIPMPVIAAILVFASVRMVEFPVFARLWKHNRQSFALAIIVGAVTVIWDPIIGILAGVAASSLIMMERTTRAQCEVWMKGDNDVLQVGDERVADALTTCERNGTLTYAIRGQLVYLNAQGHVARFSRGLSRYARVILNLKGLQLVDDDGEEALNEIIELCRDAECQIVVSGVSEALDRQLCSGVPAYAHLVKEKAVVPSISEALALS